MRAATKSFSVAVVWGLLGCLAGPGIARADDALRHIQQSLHDQGFYYGPIDGTPGDETTHAVKRYQIRNGLAVTGELNDETTRSIEHTGTAVAKSGGGSNGSGKITGDSPRSGAASSRDEDRRYAQGGGAAAPPVRPTPAYRPPPAADDDAADDIPPPSAPANRPDLRVAPSGGAATTPPRGGGIPPSVALTAVFEQTPYEFAPPPVQADILRRAQSLLLRDGFYDGEASGQPNPVTFEALTNFQGVNHLRRTGRLDVATLAAMRLLPGRQPAVSRGPNPYYEGRIVR